jgi:hypothetical protein
MHESLVGCSCCSYILRSINSTPKLSAYPSRIRVHVKHVRDALAFVSLLCWEEIYIYIYIFHLFILDMFLKILTIVTYFANLK